MKKNIYNRFDYKVIFIVILFCVSCNRNYLATDNYRENRIRFNLTVDSIAQKGEFNKKKFVIIPTIDSIDINSLQFQEYAGYIKKCLERKGYTFVEDPIKAKGAITLAYGIGDPRTVMYSFSIPIWGQTGYTASSTSMSFKYSYNPHNPLGIDAVNSTTYQPSYGVTGYKNETVSVTKYNRFISLSAIDLDFYRKNKKLKEFWVTNINSEGKSNDLRQAFPFLIAGSDAYIEKDTKKIINSVAFEDDPIYCILKNSPIKLLFTVDINKSDNRLLVLRNQNDFAWGNLNITLSGIDENGIEQKHTLKTDYLKPGQKIYLEIVDEEVLKRSANTIQINCDTAYGSTSIQEQLFYKANTGY